METLQYFTIISILIELSLVVYLAKNKKITKKFYKAILKMNESTKLRLELMKQKKEYARLQEEVIDFIKE